MYRPGDNDLNSASVSPPPKYLRASAFAAMAASSAAVPSWNPLEVKPMTALTKIVFAPRNASFTRASANETGATSRKYPYVLPATRSRTRTGLVVFLAASFVETSPHTPSRGTHPHPLKSALSTSVDRGRSFRSISVSPRSDTRASSTSSKETPAMVIPNFAARYALYSCPPSIKESHRSAIALTVPIFVSSLAPAITARNGRVGCNNASSAFISFCINKPAYEGSSFVTPQVLTCGCHDPNASLTKTSATPASCAANRCDKSSPKWPSSPANQRAFGRYTPPILRALRSSISQFTLVSMSTMPRVSSARNSGTANVTPKRACRYRATHVAASSSSTVMVLVFLS
mmetsp:Transcript_3131/g.13068  ORF Transcript_3131/g.13068 Transcript_3131/m.13068 type:complete len:345 (+) Transcript_3131:297-1331(+)